MKFISFEWFQHSLSDLDPFGGFFTNMSLKELTLTSINPRCSVLNPPMLVSSSFISAVI